MYGLSVESEAILRWTGGPDAKSDKGMLKVPKVSPKV